MSEQCANHPERNVSSSCSSCERGFCDECLVSLHGKKLCPACFELELTLIENRNRDNSFSPRKMKKIGCGCAGLLLLCGVVFVFLLVYPLVRQRSMDPCQQNLKQIYLALQAYSADNNGKLPPHDNDLRPLQPYVGDDLQLFVCPGTQNEVVDVNDLCDSATAVTGRGMSYFYKGGLQLDSSGRGRKQQRIVWDQSFENHNGSRNVLYVDGKIRKQVR